MFYIQKRIMNKLIWWYFYFLRDYALHKGTAKTVMANIKIPKEAIYLSHEFYGGGLAVPLFISDTEALSPLEVEFNELASQWYRETRKVSSAEQMVLNPSYQKIIGMGKDALPFIFKELQKTRGHWIWALAMILRDDKAKPGMKFREAVDAWLEWGKTNGYINANTRHTIRS
jgi:hypothetical protein